VRVRNILILLAVLLVLGGVYFVVSRPEPEEPTQPTVYVWDVDEADIQHIVISLPRQDLSQAFIKISEGAWYFDDQQKTPVYSFRWGGIPLLLSGPGADRVIIKENATAEELDRYGLAEPSMIITLTLADESTMIINVGDSTPDGYNYYVKAPNSNAVALVDYTWYDVLSGLVLDPPYVPAEE
jgi:hypothetical protein